MTLDMACQAACNLGVVRSISLSHIVYVTFTYNSRIGQCFVVMLLALTRVSDRINYRQFFKNSLNSTDLFTRNVF